MGTNYYLYTDACKHCSRGDKEKHIGKDSFGWCFSLHVYPEDGIRDLKDWESILKDPNNIIKDEYGESIPVQEMLKTITNREGTPPGDVPYGCSSWEEFYRMNHAIPGPKNLLRYAISRFCVSHGEGTWDCLVGDFS